MSLLPRLGLVALTMLLAAPPASAVASASPGAQPALVLQGDSAAAAADHGPSSPDRYHVFEGGRASRMERVDVAGYAEQALAAYTGPLGVRRVVQQANWSISPPAGMTVPGMLTRTDWYFKAVEAGDYVAVVSASVKVTQMMNMATSELAYRLIVGPTSQFTENTSQIYMPMLSSTSHW
jgi:hypothetical protein